MIRDIFNQLNQLNQEVWLIILCIAIAVFALAAVIIIKISSRKSLLEEEGEKSGLRARIQAKEKQLESTPGALSPGLYKALLVAIPIALGTFLYISSGNVVMTLLGFFAGFAGPELISRQLVKRTANAFEAKYERALRDMVASLRAGMSISQAVQQICNSPFIDDRIQKEFRHVDSDIKVGKSVKEAFIGMGERVSTVDTRDVATAISFQSEVGGSEADIIENIARSISSRIAQRKEIKSLFSGTSATIAIVSILPFLILAFCIGTMDDMREFYFSSPGNFFVLVAAIAFMLVGIVVIRKLASTAKDVR